MCLCNDSGINQDSVGICCLKTLTCLIMCIICFNLDLFNTVTDTAKTTDGSPLDGPESYFLMRSLVVVMGVILLVTVVGVNKQLKFYKILNSEYGKSNRHEAYIYDYSSIASKQQRC